MRTLIAMEKQANAISACCLPVVRERENKVGTQ